MEIEETWSASSVDTIQAEDSELSDLVGIWSSQLQVSISNPARINYLYANIRLLSDDASP